MKKLLILFVEITSYNLARIWNVYEQTKGYSFTYVYASKSVTGHETEIPMAENTVVLEGNDREKIAQLHDILKATDYEMMVINGYVGTVNMWLIEYARRKHIPYAIETDTPLHIPQNPIKRLVKELYLKRIFRGKAYGFPGGTRQKEVFKHYGMDPSRIHIMPMTVDTEKFSDVAKAQSKDFYKEKHGFSGKKVILYAGRFVDVKNIPSLLSAAAKLRKRHADFVLCLIGKGPLCDDIKILADQLGIADITWVEPYKLMPELAEYYSLADTFVLPSSFEPWGLVVNEALACKVPVIAANQVGCVDDLIQRGHNGDVYETGDVDALVGLLDKWLYQKPVDSDFSITDIWNYKKYLANFESALRGIVK